MILPPRCARRDMAERMSQKHAPPVANPATLHDARYPPLPIWQRHMRRPACGIFNRVKICSFRRGEVHGRRSCPIERCALRDSFVEHRHAAHQCIGRLNAPPSMASETLGSPSASPKTSGASKFPLAPAVEVAWQHFQQVSRRHQRAQCLRPPGPAAAPRPRSSRSAHGPQHVAETFTRSSCMTYGCRDEEPPPARTPASSAIA